MKNKKSVLSVVSAAVLWGIIGIFTRSLSENNFSALEIVFVRALCAACLLFVFLILKDRSLLKISLSDIKYFIGTGILSLVFFNFCYFSAMNYSSLSVAAVLLYTAPVFVAVMSRIIWKEKIGKKGVLAIIFTFVGCIMVCFESNMSNFSFLGTLFGIGSGFGYALYSIFARFALKKYSSLTVSFYTFLFGILGSAFLVDINRVKSLVSAENIHVIIMLGLFSTVLPYILYTYGMKGLSNSSASVIATLEPVTASLVGAAVFSQSLPIVRIIGIGVVVCAVAINNIDLKNK